MLRVFVSTLVSLAMVINPLAAQSQADDKRVIQHFEAEANRLDAMLAWQTDLAALATELPTGVEPVRNWVQSETRLVPYAGLLKGAEGVFWEREGNSLDRALLLGELLKAKGETVRIGRYSIGSAAREKLLANTTATTRRHNEVSIPTATSQLTPTDLGLSDENWEQMASAIQKAAQALPELQDAMFGALTRVVQPKLRALRSNTPAQAKADNHVQAMASLLDYWVAEVRIDGEWQGLILDDFGDVDPELEWSFSYDLDEVPELYHHSVVFEVRAVLNDGTELELVSLNRSASAYEGDTVNIYMAPIRQGGIAQRAALVAELKEGRIPDDIENILEGALEGEVPDYRNVHYWLPMISTNQGIVQTSGVDIGGTTVPFEDIEALAENDTAFGTVGLAAVVVDVVTLFDKEVQSRERRELLSYGEDGEFTRVAVHSAYDVQTRRYSRGELEYRSLRGASEIATLLEDGEPKHFNPPCLPCQIYGFVRWGIGEDYSDTFLSRPNIAGLKQYHLANKEGPDTSAYVFDIVENAVDVYTGRSVQSFDPFTVRVEQGLRDSVTETLLMSIDKNEVISGATVSVEKPKSLREASIFEVQSNLPRSLSVKYEETTPRDAKFLLANTDALDADVVWWRLDPMKGDLLSHGKYGEGFGVIAGFAIVGLLIAVGAHAYFACDTYNASGSRNCGIEAAKRVLLVSATLALALAIGEAVVAISLAYVGAFLWAVIEALALDLEDWLNRRNEAEELPETPAPMCVDLASIVPNGLAGSIGTDGGVCGLSCGQLLSLGGSALNFCKSWGGSYCDVWNNYYVPEIPRCCTGGAPICR